MPVRSVSASTSSVVVPGPYTPVVVALSGMSCSRLTDTHLSETLLRGAGSLRRGRA